MYREKIYFIIIQYILIYFLYLTYLYNNMFGLLLSILAFITGWQLKYSYSTLIKAYLIVSLSLLIFLTNTNMISNYIFNRIATFLLMLNFFVLIFSFETIGKKELGLIICILFIIITTPTIKYKNNDINMQSYLIDKDLWVILQTIVLSVFYLTNPNFYMDPSIYNVLFSLFISTIIHFTSNKWLVARALTLVIIIIFNIFYH